MNQPGSHSPSAPQLSAPAPTPEVPVSFRAWLRGNAVGLLIGLGLLVGAYLYFGEEWLWNVTKVALGLGFIIFIHELGHFAVAKWCDVYVETFSIGFGPALPGCNFKKGETTYKIALLPLGGYVKMLGEGEGDGDEDDDNPRSFKNKPVGQRMAIISAGVIMNLISGCLFFVWVYMAHGEYRVYGTVGSVEPGSPAWENGVRSNSRFLKIGAIDNPYFDDFQREVMLSSEGQRIPMTFTPADSPGKRIEVVLEPRRDKHNKLPLIGIASGSDLRLVEKRRPIPAPVMHNSAADKAQPAFAFNDTILGTTDPENPTQVKPIWTGTEPMSDAHLRYHEFRQRLDQLAGKDMVIRVRRAGAAGEVVDIHVPPAYHYTLGLRMRMGQVAAVRKDSPAERKGVQTPDPEKNQDGDIIRAVEVAEGGKRIRFSFQEKEPPEEGVEVRELDPARLPWELKEWARRTSGDRQVTLIVLRKTGQGLGTDVLKLNWDEERQFDREDPNHLQAPLSIPALGLAYHIETLVADVRQDSIAAREGIKKGDVIKAVRFRRPGSKPGESTPEKWHDLESNQWAFVAVTFQAAENKTVGLRLERPGEKLEVELEGKPDPTWPRAERGLYLHQIEHLQTAEGSLLKALELGYKKTRRTVEMIYLSLKAMIFGRISPTLTSGPIGIAQIAYSAAGQGFYEFLMFLALISINLAVINFLPIPLLDGGHMVFLIYEKLRGKPASDRVMWAAMVTGIALIAAIFLFASYQDVMRLLF